MAKDVTEMVTWLAGGELPETVREFGFDPRLLRDVTPRQRAVYRGVIGLVLREHPRDFHTGSPITSEAMLEQGIDDHHIFPQAYLEKKEPTVSARLRDCVLNRTLIDRTTNKRISNRSPSSYLRDIENQVQSGFTKLLQSHLLPAGPSSPLARDEFEAFLEWRQEAIWQRIQEVTGVTMATDLLIDEPEELSA